MDNRIAIFLVTCACVMVALLIGVAVGSGELIGPVLIIATLVIFTLLAYPEIAAILTVALYASGITLPGLPGQLNLSEALALAVGGCTLMLLVFQRATLPKFSLSHRFLLGFVVVVFLTGLYRGFGFQFLGSSQWGGFTYIKVFLAASLVLTLPRINVAASAWPRTVLWLGLLAPLPLIADLLVLRGANFGVINLFVQTGQSLSSSLAEQGSGEGVGRLQSAGVAATSMIVAFLAVVPTEKILEWRRLQYGLMTVVIITLSLMGGFRLMTATLVLTIFFVAILQGSLNGPRVVAGIIFLAAGTLVVYLIAPALPTSVQRTISWLPGIQVSNLALSDAQNTVDWRLDVWREALRYIPDYFWIGKGFSYDGSLFLSAMGGAGAYDPINWAMVTGAYHNGYLSSLLVTGIFGFLIGIPLLIAVVFRHWKITRAPWRDERLHRCHQAFFASEACIVGIYLTVYGDVSASFPPFFFFWAIMESLRECDDRLTASAPSRPNSPREEELGILE